MSTFDVEGELDALVDAKCEEHHGGTVLKWGCRRCWDALLTRCQDATREVAILAERERCVNLPCPPARFKEAGRFREAKTSRECRAYNQAWKDYAAAIRQEPMT